MSATIEQTAGPDRSQWPDRSVRVRLRSGGRAVRRWAVRTWAAGLAVLARLGRRAARTGWTVVQGFTSWARRSAGGLTYAHHRDQIRMAKAAGDQAAAGEWADRLEKAKDARQARLLALPREVLLMVLIGVGAFAAVWVVLLVGGVVSWLMPDGFTWTSWWSGIGSAVALATDLGKFLGVVFAWLAVPAVLFIAWNEGKRSAQPPRWLMTADEQAQAGAELTPSKVVTAFRDLGIAPLASAIKDMPDGGARMLSPIKLAGRGVEVDVTLPSGVDTSQIQGRRRKLAENLDRHRHELFISIPPAPRTVRLWIADRGTLDKPIGKSPLVIDPDTKANTRTGRAPWGEDLRGDSRSLSLHQRHVLVTGLSNQGKTAAMRALALWVARDPRAQLWIADLKGPKDWAMFEGLADELIIGPTDEHVIATTEMVEAAAAEMDRRTQAGGTHPPLFVIVDEAQVAYMCPATDEQRRPYGGSKNTSRYFMAARRIQNQGRAVDVVFWEGTQDPTNQNLPKLTREGKHVRASLVVGTEAQARMALGEAAVDAGAAPHELRQGLDKGTLVVAGDGFDLEPGETSLTIRTYFIDDDEATRIAEQAKAGRKPRRRLAVVDPDAPPPDDLAAVLEALRGEDRVGTTVVLQRLGEDDPDRYEGWTHQALAALLKDAGAPVVKSNGTKTVVRTAVVHALGRRDGDATAG